MHPIQKEMRRLEYAVGKDPKPEVPIDEVIASLIDFKGDLDKEFDPILGAECKRAVHLAKSHYMAYATDSPERVLVAVGFLQGVTFARAARNVNEK